MSEQRIKAVIFDLGETLINFGKVNTIKFFLQGASLSYDYLKSINPDIPPYPLYAVRALLTLRFRHLLSNITGRDFDAKKVLAKVAAKHKTQLDQQQLNELVWLWYEPLSKAGKVEPDLGDTLKKLKQAGLKLGILSNTFVNASALERHLSEYIDLNLFDTKLYSYQFEYKKPDPLIFIDTADRMNLRLENIVYVGDRINKDIKPAIDLGMTAVMKKAYTNKGKKVPKEAHQISAISELIDIVQNINSDQ
ncbi:MAG: HAD family hydrolase [Planctomycetes bacterium]|nr:HAD family hydrolase [Planctomycetota bacterium]MBL7107508.1 HAD family hydrolase [Phycisphaerae bacterium]